MPKEKLTQQVIDHNFNKYKGWLNVCTTVVLFEILETDMPVEQYSDYVFNEKDLVEQTIIPAIKLGYDLDGFTHEDIAHDFRDIQNDLIKRAVSIKLKL